METYRAGTHALDVRPHEEACSWSLWPTGPPGATNRRIPFTLSGSRSATTAPFTIGNGRDITWSYRCPADALIGDFTVNVHPDPFTIHDYDGRGSGVEHFDSGGT